MPAPTMTLLIAPDGRVRVSLHDSNGAQMGPPREIAANLDWRLGAFVDAVQAIAGQKLASLKATTAGPDGEPVLDGAHGEQVR